MSEQVCPGKSQLNAFFWVKSASGKKPLTHGVITEKWLQNLISKIYPA